MAAERVGLGTYLALLHRGRVALPFAAAVVARLPLSMAPLSIVLLVSHLRGSYAPAGLVTGAYAAGTALGSPVWGRAMDRFGQSRVIAGSVVVSAGLLTVLALAAVGGAGDVALIAASAGSGATSAPFSAAMRSTWRALLPDPVERRAAYAMDAAAVESVFVVGPLVVSLLLVVTPPVGPLVASAGLLAIGGLAYASTPTARSRPHGQGVGDRARRRELAGTGRSWSRTISLGALLSVTLTMAVAFGLLDTSLAATARSVLHAQARLGLLFAATAGGSMIGGLTYGTSAGHEREHRRLPVLLLGFGLGLAVVALLLSAGAPPLAALLPVLFCLGLMISPSMIICQGLVDRLALPGRGHEAQAWLSTSITTGVAGGTAAAGTIIASSGVPASFASASSAVAVAFGVSLLAQRRWRTTSQRRDVATIDRELAVTLHDQDVE